MYKEHMKYKDFDGNDREEDFYFNLTEAEVIEMEMGISGGLTALVKRILAEQDSAKMVEIFKDLILKSYGVKALDGRTFDKSPEVVKTFMSTQAYSDLFTKLCTDSKYAATFFNGIVNSKNTNTVPESNGPALIGSNV